MGMKKIIKVMEAKSLWGKSKGLIGKKKITPLLLRTRFGIHTVGVKSPIDILVVDKRNRVVKLTRSLRPNRLFFWNPIYNTVLELPQGYIEKEHITIGDNVLIDIKNS